MGRFRSAFFSSLVVVGIIFQVSSSFARDFRVNEIIPGELYRGTYPETDEDFSLLRKVGIKTVLDLRVMRGESEREAVLAHGISNFFHIPIMPFPYPPSDEKVIEGIKVLASPDLYPIFVHCYFGEERTGLLMALYQIYLKGMSTKEAENQLLNNYGFRPYLVPGLYYYFLQRKDVRENRGFQRKLLESLGLAME